MVKELSFELLDQNRRLIRTESVLKSLLRSSVLKCWWDDKLIHENKNDDNDFNCRLPMLQVMLNF